MIEPHGALVDITFTNFRSDINLNMNYFARRENDEGIASDSLPAADFTIGNAESNVIDTDEKLSARYRGLIAKQWEIFGLVHQ